MLKLRDFWLLIAVISFIIGIYDFVDLKRAIQSGDLLRETRLRADAYTEIGFGLGSVIIYELAAINAKLRQEYEDKWKISKMSQKSEVSNDSGKFLGKETTHKVKL